MWVRGEKKVGQAHFSVLTRVEKAWLSIARSFASLGSPQCVDPSRIASAIASFEACGTAVSPCRVDQGHRVLLALEADRRVGDVVEDDQVGALALELLAGPLDASLAVLGGEADDRLPLAAGGGEARRGCPRSAPGAARASPRAASLPARDLGGAEVGGGGRHHQDVAGGELGLRRRRRARRRSRRRCGARRRARAGRRWRRSGSPRPRAGRRRRRGRSPCGRWSGCRGSGPGRSARGCRRR